MVGRSVHIAVEHSLDPLFYIYPPLAFYVFAVAESILRLLPGQQLGLATQVDPSAEILAARLTSAASFVGATGFLYLAAARNRGWLAGLVAASLFAVAPLAVRQAHFATTDMLACGLLAAVFWAGTVAGSRRGFLLAGFLCGLAAATKYTSGVAIVYLLVLAVSAEDRPWRAASALAGAALAFTAPLLLAAPPERYLEGLRFLARRSAEGYGSLPIGLIYHPTHSLLVGFGLGSLLLALAGGILAAARRRPLDLALLAFLAAYLAVVGFSHEVFFRYSLPMLPALSLLAASLSELASTGRRAALLGVVTALLLAPSAVDSGLSDRLLTRADTRAQAAAWLDTNAQPGSSVAVSSYWAEPFYDDAALATRPLHPLYLTGNRIADSFQLGRYTRRLLVNQPAPRCYQLATSGPPWQSPVPPGGVATFAAYRGASPPSFGYDPLDSFYLPLNGLWGIERPGPSVAIREGCQ